MLSRQAEIQQRDKQELADFRAKIDLAKFIEGFGYCLDKAETTKKTKVLRRGDNKVVVTYSEKLGYLFCDIRNKSRHGSVIDFYQTETGNGLGLTRKRLREELGTGNPKDNSSKHDPSLKPQAPHVEPAIDPLSFKPTEPDWVAIAKAWNAATWQARHPYLITRGLDAALDADLFKDCYRLNLRGNAVFPHHDDQGLCGLELRNSGFKGMLPGSIKGLWSSRNLETSAEILIVESPVDALSHWELYRSETAYLSIGGTLSTRQRELLGNVLAMAVERHQSVIVATDNDVTGHDYHLQLNALAAALLDRLVPIGKDWNDDLVYCLEELV